MKTLTNRENKAIWPPQLTELGTVKNAFREKLGLLPTGEFAELARQQPYYPRGVGLTTEMLLNALVTLVFGGRIVLVVHHPLHGEYLENTLLTMAGQLELAINVNDIETLIANNCSDLYYKTLGYRNIVFFVDHYVWEQPGFYDSMANS